jgi:putative transposase
MTSPSDRQQALQLINEAVLGGARQGRACAVLSLTERTLQRWREVPADRRPATPRPVPPNALSDAERARVLAVVNAPEHASLTPHQIVPKLADEQVYLCSESTLYRLLRAGGQQHHRGRSGGAATTRNWHLDDAVSLNPERPNPIEAKAA